MKRILIYLIVLCIAFLQGGCTRSYIEDEEEPEQIVLSVLAGQSTSDAGVEDMIDEWMMEYFPGVILEWECVDWGNRFASQMRGRFAAGDIPDIMIGKAQDVQVYAKTGNLGTISSKCREKIVEEALGSVTVDGEMYGMPYNAWYQGVIYNKNIFEIYGLAPPSTMEELQDITHTLKQAGIVPFAAHFQESWKVANMTMQYMMNDIFKEDAIWGDKFREGSEGFLQNDSVRHCYLNNQFILENTWEDALQINQFESDSRFTQGEAAMYMTGSWSMQFANQYGKNIDFGIFPFPNQNGNAQLIRETNMTFMKSADTEYSELVDEIFYALLDDEKLTQEILDFTQSSSVVKGIVPIHESRIQDDIDRYEASGEIIDVTTGNAQLIWNFQNELAAQQLLWLKKEKTLDEVLQYADEHRAFSAYTKEK